MPIRVEEIIYAWMAERVCSEDSQEVYPVTACAEMDGGATLGKQAELGFSRVLDVHWPLSSPKTPIRNMR